MTTGATGAKTTSCTTSASGGTSASSTGARNDAAVLSDDPRFDLVPLHIATPTGPLVLTLHAAWDGGHHAADELARLAGRLRDFCAQRYGASSRPAGG